VVGPQSPIIVTHIISIFRLKTVFYNIFQGLLSGICRLLKVFLVLVRHCSLVVWFKNAVAISLRHCNATWNLGMIVMSSLAKILIPLMAPLSKASDVCGCLWAGLIYSAKCKIIAH